MHEIEVYWLKMTQLVLVSWSVNEKTLLLAKVLRLRDPTP